MESLSQKLFNSFHFRKLLMTEFPSGGLYLMPEKSNSFKLQGIFFVRTGIFKNGVFRFSLLLEPTFPQQKHPPLITMEHSITHPLVSPDTLIFDSSSAFSSWKTDDHIYELLKYFKYAFENIEYCCALTNVSNQAAAELYKNDKPTFFEIARDTVTSSVNSIFTSKADSLNPSHIFAFDKTIIEEEGLHDQILENMKSLSNDSSDNFSFSFERRG